MADSGIDPVSSLMILPRRREHPFFGGEMLDLVSNSLRVPISYKRTPSIL